MNAPDKLADQQLQAFNREHVNESRWRPIRECLDNAFPSGEFSFIDLGGGNGMFADRVLEEFPLAQGTVLDASELLLEANTKNPRKRVICDDALQVGKYGPVDVVFCNWLLHHLVTTGSYAKSRENIARALIAVKSALTARGRLSICEYAYDGVVDNLPSRLIFELTSIKAIAPLMRALRANTAGVGVCFQSRETWRRIVEGAGYGIESFWSELSEGAALYRKIQLVALMVKRRANIHIWGRPSETR